MVSAKSPTGDEKMPAQLSDSAWFAEAARCYVEKHQGCPWCGGSHRVFEVRRGMTVEYFCNACDFRAGHDVAADRYFSVPGEEDAGRAPRTMHQAGSS
jgi:hypothetical protein